MLSDSATTLSSLFSLPETTRLKSSISLVSEGSIVDGPFHELSRGNILCCLNSVDWGGLLSGRIIEFRWGLNPVRRF